MMNRIFWAMFVFTAVVLRENVATVAKEPSYHPWYSNCHVGMFLHFLPGGETAHRAQEEFDVEQLADQIASTGVDYFILTIYQNSGWFNAPNAEYDRVTGYKAGDRCSARDIPMEMADALAKRNIRLYLYVTGQVPNTDRLAQKAFGLDEGPTDQIITLEFAQKWGNVFRDWSLRYGDKVSGWWVDGCYQWCRFNEEIAAIYHEGLTAGNPNAVVAFNPGVKNQEWKRSDFTAGEINEIGIDTDGKIEPGQKRHILTYIGQSWGQANTRFTTKEWIDWAQKNALTQTALTLDTGLTPDGGFSDEALAQIRAITEAVKSVQAE